MRVKEGVNLDGMHSHIWPTMVKLDRRVQDEGWPEITITSGREGRHSSERSRHYLGTAVDIRTWTTPESGVQMVGTMRQEFWQKVQMELGEDWFLLDHNTHFHLDYRPRYKDETN